MQRRYMLIAVLLSASIGLAGCGQALNLDAGKPSIPTATAGLPDQAQASAPPAGNVGGPFESAVASADAPAPSEAAAPPVDVPAQSAAPESIASSPAESTAPPPPAEPTTAPTVNPEFANVQLPTTEERWRYIQADRTPLPNVQTYTTPSKQILWWYDPIFGQPVALGQIQGDFPVQATFRLRGQEVEALEVPYQVNQSFGITLPSAIVNRMKNAGVGEWAETFVFKTDDIRPK